MNKPQIRIYKRNHRTLIIKNKPQYWLEIKTALKLSLKMNLIKMIYL